jgi:hypothetical protein
VQQRAVLNGSIGDGVMSQEALSQHFPAPRVGSDNIFVDCIRLPKKVASGHAPNFCMSNAALS